MEDRLKAYRRQQERQAFLENIKIRFRNMINPPRKENYVKIPMEDDQDAKLPKEVKPAGDDPREEDITTTESESEPEEVTLKTPTNPIGDRWKYCLIALYSLFWATCWAIAIQLQFGAVFLVISALLGIYFNTRTGPKPKNEMSAYSVFNPNVEAIDGTLKAEQFEREIRYGSMSVR